MKQQKSTILYLFIILIILSGIALFIFKDFVADGLLSSGVETPTVNSTRVNSELKLDVLRDSRIKALKNYVSTFDYENLDKSQEIILTGTGKEGDITISNPDDEATSTATSTKINQDVIRVRVGNSNPFLIKKAVAK